MKYLKLVIKIISYIFVIFVWFIYTYLTLDKSPEALTLTGGNPMPNRYSFLILSVIVILFLRNYIFNRKVNFGSIFGKIIALLFLLFGILVFFA